MLPYHELERLQRLLILAKGEIARLRYENSLLSAKTEVLDLLHLTLDPSRRTKNYAAAQSDVVYELGSMETYLKEILHAKRNESRQDVSRDQEGGALEGQFSARSGGEGRADSPEPYGAKPADGPPAKGKRKVRRLKR